MSKEIIVEVTSISPEVVRESAQEVIKRLRKIFPDVKLPIYLRIFEAQTFYGGAEALRPSGIRLSPSYLRSLSEVPKSVQKFYLRRSIAHELGHLLTPITVTSLRTEVYAYTLERLLGLTAPKPEERKTRKKYIEAWELSKKPEAIKELQELLG